ncbi:hypothetical protein GCM10010416_66470 [Streptomyces caniferus]
MSDGEGNVVLDTRERPSTPDSALKTDPTSPPKATDVTTDMTTGMQSRLLLCPTNEGEGA